MSTKQPPGPGWEAGTSACVATNYSVLCQVNEKGKVGAQLCPGLPHTTMLVSLPQSKARESYRPGNGKLRESRRWDAWSHWKCGTSVSAATQHGGDIRGRKTVWVTPPQTALLG